MDRSEQLVWLVRKGDLILPDEPIVSRFDLEGNFTSKHLISGKSMRIVFVASAIDNPPSTLAELPRGMALHFFSPILLSTIEILESLRAFLVQEL